MTKTCAEKLLVSNNKKLSPGQSEIPAILHKVIPELEQQ